MTVLNFSHLKDKISPAAEVVVSMSPPPVQEQTKPASGVASFAYLKKSPAKVVVQASAPVVEDEKINQAPAAPIRLQRPHGIGALKTALLVKTNYCEPCPRFWPADENERAMGVLYGRCCRSGEPGSLTETEVWKNIPALARVWQCRYHLENKFEEGLKTMNTKIIWEGVEA